MAANETERKALFEKLTAGGATAKAAAEASGYNPTVETVATEAATPQAKASPSDTPKAKPDKATRTLPKPTMNANQAQKLIFGIVIGVTALTIFGDIVSGKARGFDSIPRRMIGGTVAGILLMLFAIPVPRLAVGIAALTGAGYLFVSDSGTSVVEAITKIMGTGSTPNTPSYKPPSAGDGSVKPNTPI